MRFVFETVPAAAPANQQPASSQAPSAIQSSPETPREAVKTSAMPRLPEPPRKPEPARKKASTRPYVESLPETLLPSQVEPLPMVGDTKPADVSVPQPIPPVEAPAAAGLDEALEAPTGGGRAQQHAAVASLHVDGDGPAAFGSSGGPGFLRRVLPRYPRLEREMGREGTVVLSLTIDAKGILQDVEVIESAGHGFDEEALRAMQASTFKAAVRNGKPVASRALLPIRFMLRGSGDD